MIDTYTHTHGYVHRKQYVLQSKQQILDIFVIESCFFRVWCEILYSFNNSHFMCVCMYVKAINGYKYQPSPNNHVYVKKKFDNAYDDDIDLFVLIRIQIELHNNNIALSRRIDIKIRSYSFIKNIKKNNCFHISLFFHNQIIVVCVCVWFLFYFQSVAT